MPALHWNTCNDDILAVVRDGSGKGGGSREDVGGGKGGFFANFASVSVVGRVEI